MKKIESFEEYTNLAKRTLVDLGSDKKNSYHMFLGLITELGEFLDPFKKNLAYGKELDMVNVGEELADYCWYIAGAITISPHRDDILKKLDPQLKKIPDSYSKEDLKLAGEEFKSLPHKSAYSFSEALKQDIEDVETIYSFCLIVGLDFWQILTNNIEKLKVRFPEKFTEEKAKVRDLDAERKELEK